MKSKTPIAIVGMGGVFPGASDINIFWNNILNKIDTANEVPEHRWIVKPDAMYHPFPMPDKVLSKRACLIDDNILKSVKAGLQQTEIEKNLIENLTPLYQILLYAGEKLMQAV